MLRHWRRFPSDPLLVTQVQDLTDGTMNITFNGPRSATGFGPVHFEVFAAGTWHVSTIPISQVSANTINLTNLFLDGLGGQPWRMLTAAAGIAVPQSGTTIL